MPLFGIGERIEALSISTYVCVKMGLPHSAKLCAYSLRASLEENIFTRTYSRLFG